MSHINNVENMESRSTDIINKTRNGQPNQLTYTVYSSLTGKTG